MHSEAASVSHWQACLRMQGIPAGRIFLRRLLNTAYSIEGLDDVRRRLQYCWLWSILEQCLVQPILANPLEQRTNCDWKELYMVYSHRLRDIGKHALLRQKSSVPLRQPVHSTNQAVWTIM